MKNYHTLSSFQGTTDVCMQLASQDHKKGLPDFPGLRRHAVGIQSRLKRSCGRKLAACVLITKGRSSSGASAESPGACLINWNKSVWTPPFLSASAWGNPTVWQQWVLWECWIVNNQEKSINSSQSNSRDKHLAKNLDKQHLLRQKWWWVRGKLLGKSLTLFPESHLELTLPPSPSGIRKRDF